VNFKRWIPLLEAMYNASLYTLPLLLERLLNPCSPTTFAGKSSVSASGQRPAHTDRAVAQWILFIVRHVARQKLTSVEEAAKKDGGESTGDVGKEATATLRVEEPAEMKLPSDAECKIPTIDNDLPVEWSWLLKLAMHHPHSCTKYYLKVLCFLANTPQEKTEHLEKALETFLSSEPDKDDEAAQDVDEHMDDEEGGWQLCSGEFLHTSIGFIYGSTSLIEAEKVIFF
jgi:hypothetical protein